MKREFKYYAIIFIFLVLIILYFTLLDYGETWEELKKGYFWDYISLFIFRLIIYFVPAIFLFLFFKKKDKLGLVDAFEKQFATYALIKVFWNVLALEYIFESDIFSFIDSYVVLASLFLTFKFKKKIKMGLNI